METLCPERDSHFVISKAQFALAGYQRFVFWFVLCYCHLAAMIDV